MIKKTFIDCGYYNGKGTQLFRKHVDKSGEYRYIAFEVNKGYKKLDNVEYIEKLVWVQDDVIDFYSSGARRGQANSVYKNPKRDKRQVCRKVETIDFGKWITRFKDDFVVVKMDIEGAEFEVLESLFNSRAIEIIDYFFLEFHHERAGKTLEYVAALKERLKKELILDTYIEGSDFKLFENIHCNLK